MGESTPKKCFMNLNTKIVGIDLIYTPEYPDNIFKSWYVVRSWYLSFMYFQKILCVLQCQQ